jgi:hypothetical protein
MASLGEFAKRAERLIVNNSPVILTAIGVAGTLTTAYLTGKATFKAAKILEENEIRLDPLEAKEKVQLVWRLYIPAATTALLTVSAIISANRVGSRRAAALAAAYSLSEKAFEEYRSKIVDRLGEKKEQAIRDEIAQERVDRDPVGNREVILAGEGSVLCYEAYTGRYFLCDMETLRKAQNDINHQVIHDSYASLSDLYDEIGLPHTANSEEVGWNADRLLDLRFSAVLTDTGKPCISVEYDVSPVRHYHRLQ